MATPWLFINAFHSGNVKSVFFRVFSKFLDAGSSGCLRMWVILFNVLVAAWYYWFLLDCSCWLFDIILTWLISWVSPVTTTTSRVNATFLLVEMPRFYSWKCHVSWKSHVSSRGNKYFHGRISLYTREIPRVATRGHACKNEVVIERYRRYVRSYCGMVSACMGWKEWHIFIILIVLCRNLIVTLGNLGIILSVGMQVYIQCSLKILKRLHV